MCQYQYARIDVEVAAKSTLWRVSLPVEFSFQFEIYEKHLVSNELVPSSREIITGAEILKFLLFEPNLQNTFNSFHIIAA